MVAADEENESSSVGATHDIAPTELDFFYYRAIKAANGECQRDRFFPVFVFAFVVFVPFVTFIAFVAFIPFTFPNFISG